MAWTIIWEDENGVVIRKLQRELTISNSANLYSDNFRVLKYIDPHGDTTFNRMMLQDLISDLTELRNYQGKEENISQEIIELVTECQRQVHTYIKFYGE